MTPSLGRNLTRYVSGFLPTPTATLIPVVQAAWLLKCRVKELGGFDSSMTLRSRHVTLWTKLHFKSKPSSISDPPADLDLAERGSAELYTYRTWLLEQLPYFKNLPPVGNKCVDNYHAKLVERCEGELRRLNAFVVAAWRKELAHAGLIFLESLGKPPPPIPVSEGAPVCAHVDYRPLTQ